MDFSRDLKHTFTISHYSGRSNRAIGQGNCTCHRNTRFAAGDCIDVKWSKTKLYYIQFPLLKFCCHLPIQDDSSVSTSTIYRHVKLKYPFVDTEMIDEVGRECIDWIFLNPWSSLAGLFQKSNSLVPAPGISVTGHQSASTKQWIVWSRFSRLPDLEWNLNLESWQCFWLVRVLPSWWVSSSRIYFIVHLSYPSLDRLLFRFGWIDWIGVDWIDS